MMRYLLSLLLLCGSALTQSRPPMSAIPVVNDPRGMQPRVEVLSVSGDAEALHYAYELGSAFMAAGWTVTEISTFTPKDKTRQGLTIVSRGGDRSDFYAIIIREALGVKATFDLEELTKPRTVIQIKVWPQ